MNLLHAITAKRETSPALKKLQASCEDATSGTCPVTYSKEELKEKLNPVQYHVTQEKGTERAYSGKYVSWNEEGIFTCIVCDNKLFTSDSKFHSGCGWPSFTDVIEKGNVTFKEDYTHGMQRLEVMCSDCGAHLGHVFDDGPISKKQTGLRYCVNSASLEFKKHTTDK